MVEAPAADSPSNRDEMGSRAGMVVAVEMVGAPVRRDRIAMISKRQVGAFARATAVNDVLDAIDRARLSGATQSPGGTHMRRGRRMRRWTWSGHVYVAGKHWAITDVTGTASSFLKVPLDGTTAPSYIDKATWDAGESGGFPDDAEYYHLGRTSGDIHVVRG